jgi:hypothetical protein
MLTRQGSRNIREPADRHLAAAHSETKPHAPALRVGLAISPPLRDG